jgi:hypothetical protein
MPERQRVVRWYFRWYEPKNVLALMGLRFDSDWEFRKTLAGWNRQWRQNLTYWAYDDPWPRHVPYPPLDHPVARKLELYPPGR